MNGPYSAPLQKESLGKKMGNELKSWVGMGSNVGYSKKIKKALVSIPEADEATRMNEFKRRYRLQAPGGGTTAGPDGEIDMPGHGGLEDGGK